MLLSLTPPTITSGAATSVSGNSATLNATVNPQGSTDTTYFQYSINSAFTPTVTTTLGSGFSVPAGLAVDAAGDVFVADYGNSAVKEILPNGAINTIGSGFNYNAGVAVDSAGDVFVADTHNNAVKEVLPNGTIRSIGFGYANEFGVAVDSAGNVYVADTFHNVVKEVLPNGTINTLGSGFSRPEGIALDAAGDVFVADFASNSVKEILPNGLVNTLGTGFNGPDSVAVDAAGDVFVTDFNNNAVKEILPNGAINIVSSGFAYPDGVAVDAAGDFFVADYNGVARLSPSTVVATPSSLSGSVATSITATLTGLTPGTTYYYRAVATGPNGTVAGPTSSFTTSSTLNPQTINFASPTSPIVYAPGAAVSLVATGGASGNPVVFTIDGASTGAGIISGNTLTVIHAGTIVLDANQGGNASYAAAPQVQRTLVVNKATPTATLFVINSPQAFTGSAQSAFVGISNSSVAGAVSNILAGGSATQTAAGTYAVTASFIPSDSIDYNTLTGLSAGNFAIVIGPVTVNTGSATSVSASGATINGAVNPQGSTYTAYFQYSTDSHFTPTVAATFGSGFSFPASVSVDSIGDVFVADNNNNAVKEVLPNGAINTIGSGFKNPAGVAVDATGDVFVLEYLNNVVKEVMPNGTIRTFGSGFGSLLGVAVDAAGDVFVADFLNNAIKEILPNGTIHAVGSGFNKPDGVWVDATGDVFVADTNNNAIKEVLPNGTINTLGTGFNQPTGVTVDAAGNVYVADNANSAVKEILPNGTVSTLGSGFSRPYGLAVDAAGNVFVADTSNSRVIKLSPPTLAATPSSMSVATPISGTLTGLSYGTTYFYRAVAVGPNGILTGSTNSFTTTAPLVAPTITGQSATSVSLNGATLNATVNPQGWSDSVYFQYSTDSSFVPSVVTTIATGLFDPNGVSVDAAGDIFVADQGNGNVKEYMPNGTVNAIGSGFGNPFVVAVNSAGNVFVSDTLHKAVHEVLPNGTITTIGSGFNFPEGLAIDAAGDVFVADAILNNVFEILPNGSQHAIGSGFFGPTGVAVDSAGDVFVADSGHNAIEEILPNGAILTLGSGFNQPSGVAVDAAGDVFVDDEYNNAIKEILPNGAILTLGSGYNQPFGLAVDAAGDVFVADTYNGRIVELSPTKTPSTPSSLSGFSATSVSTTLTGLPSGTTYYYRAVATGANGTVAGPTNLFTTGSTLISQTISFTAPASPIVFASGATVSLVATGGASGNPVVFTVDNASTGAGSISGNTLTVTRVGTIVLDANQAASTTYAAALQVQQALVVTKATPIAILAVSIPPLVYNGTGQAANVRVVASTVPGTVKNVLTGGSATQTAVGTYAVTADFVPIDTIDYYSLTALPAGNLLIANGPLTVTTGSATSVSTSGANLNGTANPQGSTDTAYFSYSTDNSFIPTVPTTLGTGFSGASGLAVDAAGDVFVGYNTCVLKILPNRAIQTLGSGFSLISGVAVDAAGDVFVANVGTSDIREIQSNGAVRVIGGGFKTPEDVAVDAAGDVFVADTYNSAIKEVFPNGTINTIGSGYNIPTGVTVDAAGDVFVADYYNNAVKEIFPNGTIHVIGSGFSNPSHVAVDAAGDVFVSDAGHFLLKEVLTNGTILNLGSGTSQPGGVAVDAAGDLFVDYVGSRVVEFSPPAVAATPSTLTGSSSVSFSGTLNGLSAGTTYYYRAIATGPNGTVAGSINSFTTLIPQSVSFTAPATPIVYAPSETVLLAATGGASGLPVLFSIDPSSTGTGSISGNTLTVTHAGTFVLYANQGGNGTYAAATQVQQTLVVNKATPTAILTFSNSSQTYTGSGQAANVGVVTSSVPGAAGNILTGGSATQTTAGTYAVTASFVPTDTADYNTLTGLPAGSFVIAKATPTATLTVGNSPQTYTGSRQAATVDVSTSSVPGAASNVLTGGSTTQTTAGTYAVTASFVPTDTADYNTLTNLSAGSFVITKAATTTTLSAPPTTGIGQSVSIVATVASSHGIPGGSVTFLSGTTTLGTASLNGLGKATFTSSSLSAGAYNLTAAYSSAPSYAGSTSAPTLVLIGTSNQRYVNQLYVDLFKRNADTTGLSAWSGVLDNGTQSRAQVATALTSSREYDGIVVDAFYVTYLGRHADTAGLNAWVDQMQKGLNAEVIRAGILGSDEYYNRTGPNNQNGTDATFITSLYQTFLGRGPDSAGLAAWLAQLNNNPANRQAIASGISNSDENRTAIITNFYQTYLHRNPDAAGLAAWKSQLAGGISQPAIISFFVTTSEYLNINHIT